MKLIINPIMIGLAMPKQQPAVQTLVFATAPELSGVNYIDLGQAVSIANRRAYRQGLNWSIAGIKIITANAGTVIVSKLNQTWVTSNAWEKAFRLWHQMNKQVLDTDPGLKPKFYDFKVGFDKDHDFTNNLLPIGSNLATATAGEWVQSTVQLPYDAATGATKEYALHMVGPEDTTHKSCIIGYADSRALITTDQPDLPGGYDTNWMTQLMDTGENFEQIAQDLAIDNDETPYPTAAHPGGGSQLIGEIHDYSTISATTVGSSTYVKGGTFPCGLIKLEHTFSQTANYIIQIDLIPGKTRGYLAEPMTKM